MRYIVSAFLIGILLFAVLASAQVVPPSPGSITNPVVQFNSPGFAYQYSPNTGASTKFYDHGNGITGYTSKDSMGRVISQGTVYDAIQKDRAMDPIGIPPPASNWRDSIGSASLHDSGLLP